MINQELYNQAIEAGRSHALTKTATGHELTVVAEHYWDDTQLELTLEYDQHLKPVSYKLTHCKPREMILTGTGLAELCKREVYGVTSHTFH